MGEIKERRSTDTLDAVPGATTMNNEQFYYDTLKRIAKGYQTPDQLRRNSERDFGCRYHEALEMTYENLQMEAANAIRGKRRPKQR